MPLLATLVGQKPTGEQSHMVTGDAAEVKRAFRNRNPDRFVKLSYFDQAGRQHTRKVIPNGDATKQPAGE